MSGHLSGAGGRDAGHDRLPTLSHLNTAVRGIAGGLLGGYVLAVAVILLNADPSLATEVIGRVEAGMRERGVPAWMTWGDRVQLMLNALMFAPITWLASVAVPRHAWGNWVAYSFAGSGVVEIVQAFALEPRAAQYADVVANTLGGLTGALLALPLTLWLRRISARRSG